MNERIYYSHEAAMRAQRERLIMALIVTGFGIAIGAIAALLLAPRSGDEVRRQLGETLEQAAAQGRETAEQLAQSVKESANKIGK